MKLRQLIVCIPRPQVRRSYPLNLYITIICILILTQLSPAKPDPNDEACLSQLYSSFLNPTLTNWSKPFFSNPCYNGFDSHMFGITCNNNRVYRLSLPNSNLRGTLSPSLTKCTNLQTLDISSNSVSGEIPPDINDLTNLVILNLSNNRLSGSIPSSLYLCAYLNVIDLHSNSFTGTIPPQLGLLARLSTFDVSSNRLSGMIPASLGNRSSGSGLARFNASDFRGNKELFGYPLEVYSKGGNGLSVMVIVGIGLGSGLLSLVISFVVVCVWLKVSEQKLMAAEEVKINNFMPDY